MNIKGRDDGDGIDGFIMHYLCFGRYLGSNINNSASSHCSALMMEGVWNGCRSYSTRMDCSYSARNGSNSARNRSKEKGRRSSLEKCALSADREMAPRLHLKFCLS
eukprot:scaffold3998_cov153-Skeletonema_dohrnii-CCMP3373.AAC.9